MRRAAVALLLLIALGAATWTCEGDPRPDLGGPSEHASDSVDATPLPSHGARRDQAADTATGADRAQDDHDSATSAGGAQPCRIRGSCLIDGGAVGLRGARVKAYPIAQVTDGEPAWWASSVVTPAGRGFPDEPAAQTVSDEQGAFALDVDPGWIWHVVSEAPGRLTQTATFVADSHRIWFAFPDPEETSDWAFRLLTAAGRPVAGAEVSVHPGGAPQPPARVLTADATGVVTCRLAAWDAVRVRADGFATVTVERDIGGPEPGQRTVILRPPGRLAGRVVDTGGHPLAGCYVFAGSIVYESTRTDDDGRFAFSQLSAASEGIPLEISRRGYLDHHDFVAPHREDLLVTLARATSIAGRLDPPPDQRTQSIEVRAEGADGRRYDRGHADLETGAFRVADLPPGPVRIRAEVVDLRRFGTRSFEATTHVGEVHVDVPAGGALQDLVVPLEPAPLSFVLVEVVDAQGDPAEDVEITLRGARVDRLLDTDEDGRGLAAVRAPPGTAVRIDLRSLRSPGPAPRLGVAATTQAETTGALLRVVLPPTARVVVELLDPSGRPFPAPAVPWVEWSDPVRDARNLPQGRIELDVDPGAPFTLRGGVSGVAVFQREFVLDSAMANAIRCATVRPASVRLRVEAPDGSTFHTEEVEFRSGAGGARAARHTRQEDEPEGTFVFRDLLPGPWVLRMRGADDSPALFLHGTTEPGEDVDLGVVRIGQDPRRRGTVTDPAGRPLPGVRVMLRTREDAQEDWTTASAPDGSFTLPVPSGYRGLVTAEHPRYAGAVLDVADVAAEGPIRLQLGAPTYVRVSCAPADVDWAWDFHVTDGTVEWWPWIDRETLPDGRMAHVCQGMPPGLIRIRGEGTSPTGVRYVAETWVRVEPGATVTPKLTSRPE